jgi:hypothetical protein
MKNFVEKKNALFKGHFSYMGKGIVPIHLPKPSETGTRPFRSRLSPCSILAFGIGVNTANFSLIDAVLRRAR